MKLEEYLRINEEVLLEDFGNLKKFDVRTFGKAISSVTSDYKIGRNSPVEVLQVKTGTQLQKLLLNKDIILAQLSIDGKSLALFTIGKKYSRYSSKDTVEVYLNAKTADELGIDRSSEFTLAKAVKLAKQYNGTWLVAKVDPTRLELENVRKELKAGRVPLPGEKREYRIFINDLRSKHLDKLKKLKMSKNEIESMDGEQILDFFKRNGLKETISVMGWGYSLHSNSISLTSSFPNSPLTVVYTRDIEYYTMRKGNVPHADSIEKLLELLYDAKDNDTKSKIKETLKTMVPPREILLKYKFDGANIVLDKIEYEEDKF